MTRNLLGLGCLFAASYLLAADPKAPDLKGYRTVETALTTKPKPPSTARIGQTGYLGVTVMRQQNRLVVEEVQPDSPAAKAGLVKGDGVLRIDEHAVKTPESFRETLQSRGAGESIMLVLEREGKAVEVMATLAATSRPMTTSTRAGRTPYLGVELGEAKENEGVKVERVTTGSPADTSGLKSGDRIMKIDGKEFTRASRLEDIMAEKRPGDALALSVTRDNKAVELKVTLSERRRDGNRGEFGPTEIWRKDVFHLAVIGIEFPDVKHNAKVPTKEWEESLFSKGSYNGKMSATGQAVHGSLNDYFLEQSVGAFRVEGKAFEWVEVSKKRGDYVQGSGTSNKTALLVEALEKVVARDGKDAFKGFDGFLFIYAGDRVNTNAGSLYYPHAGRLSFQSKTSLYALGAEGGSRMATISAFVKEFGKVIGLPDLAARPENRGSEGLGAWCAMSDTLGSGRPQHLSAWAKEKLGWIKPVVIDPSVKQKLILAPIEQAPKECYKILVRPDGSEYFLLENRRKTGFDSDLPGEGLLIWRVVNDRPILEESHGVEGPSGPTVHLSAVPYPSASNNSFTPDTVPSSRSPMGGGLPVHITEIRRLPDGRIAFHVGYEYR